MKKYALVTMSLFLAFAGFSQSSGGNDGAVTIKPAVGFNVSDFSKAPPGGESKARLGFQLGGTVLIGNKVYVEPGIFYLRRSSRYVDANTSANDIKFNIGGIYVPVAIGVNLLGDEKTFMNIHALGGVSAFFKTDANSDLHSTLKSAAYGTFAGAGVNAGIIFVDLKYEWSLTNVQKHVSDIDVGKTRSFFLNAGLRFRL